VAPESLVPAICAVRQSIDWCPPPATQHAMTAFIEHGHLDRHLHRSRTVYRQRHRLVRDTLGAVLPPGYRCVPSHAGLHLAVVGADTPDDDLLYPALVASNLLISSLRMLYRFSEPAAGFLVGFGALPTDRVSEACRTLVDGLTRLG
jgi:GntR family transcriptional regulator/MocR family aminotransferase